MNPQELYKQKLLSIPETVSLVRSHQTIVAAMAASEPVGLLSELGNHKGRLENVTVWVCLPLRLYDFVLEPEMAGHFFVELVLRRARPPSPSPGPHLIYPQ